MERMICLAIGYVFGMFQTSYFIGRMYHKDIRSCGSGNAGTTNALRTFGKKAGAITLVCDILKCVIAILIADLVFRNNCREILPLLGMYTAAGCVLGHNFPFYLNFQGGKGIAVSVGMLIVLDWRVLLICAVVFFTIFFTTHYVSLCSVSAYVAAFAAFIAFGAAGSYGMSRALTMEMNGVMGCLTVLAIYRHRSNISRLLKGTENKTYLGKSGKKKG